MKNKLTDLNDHLFAQLERLSDEDLSSEQLTVEIQRSKALTSVAEQVILNARVVLDAHKAVADRAIDSTPPMLGVDK